MEAITIQSIAYVISKIGFPAFVCIWLLWRFEKRLDRMIRLIEQMALRLGVIQEREPEL